MKNICACFHKIECRGNFCLQRPYNPVHLMNKSCPLMKSKAHWERLGQGKSGFVRLGYGEASGEGAFGVYYLDHMVRDSCSRNDSREGSRVGWSVPAQEAAERGIAFWNWMESSRTLLKKCMAAVSRQDVAAWIGC